MSEAASAAVIDDLPLDDRPAVPTGQRLDRRRINPTTWVLLAPAAALLLSFFMYPVGFAFYLGLTNLKLLGPTAKKFQFTGMANIEKMLHDPQFWSSLWLTAIFIIASGVILSTFVGMALAMLMRSSLALPRTLVGAIVIMAWMLPPVTIAIVWYAATIQDGAIPRFFGVAQWDMLSSQPMLVVCLANAWSLAGLSMLLFGAALRNIPPEVDEAARLEGAGYLRRLLQIELPLLKPTIVTTILLMTLLTIGNFAIVYIMTGGGPGFDTNILPVYSYRQAFSFNNLAYGALLGNVLVIIAGVTGFAFVRASRENV